MLYTRPFLEREAKKTSSLDQVQDRLDLLGFEILHRDHLDVVLHVLFRRRPGQRSDPDPTSYHVLLSKPRVLYLMPAFLVLTANRA